MGCLKISEEPRSGRIVCDDAAVTSIEVIDDDDKRQLLPLLRQAYKDKTHSYVPLSFTLPQEIPEFEQHVARCKEGGSNAGMFLLKTVKHLGKDLTVMTAEDALKEAQKPRSALHLFWLRPAGNG